MTTPKTKIPLKPLNKQNARILFAGMFCLILGATGSFVTQKMSQAEVNTAVQQAQIAAENAQTQAKNIRDTLCYNQVDKESEICLQAQLVIDDPNSLVPQIKGDPGDPGVGIATSTINPDGELVLTYTDGNQYNLGKVVGQNGINGLPGVNGRGITGIQCLGDGEKSYWEITFTDGTVTKSDGPCRMTALPMTKIEPTQAIPTP